MDNGRKVFVKTDGRSSDQTASSADESGKKLAHESKSTVIALPCEMCEELCPSDKLIDHQLQCRKGEKMRNKVSWKILHFKHKNLRLMNVAPAIRCQFMELRNRSLARIQSNYWIWNDSNTIDSADEDLSKRPAKQFFNATKSESASCLWNCQGGMRCNNLASGRNELA